MATREENIKAAGSSIFTIAKTAPNENAIKDTITNANATLTDPAPSNEEKALILSIASYKLVNFLQGAPGDQTPAKGNLQIILAKLTEQLQTNNIAYIGNLAGGGKQAKPKSKKASVRSAKKVSRKKATKRGGGGVAANAADIMNSTGLLRTSNDPLTQANSPAIIALTRQDPAVTAGMTGLSAIDATSDFPSSVTGEIVHNLGGLYL
jgi:hypothetical protein